MHIGSMRHCRKWFDTSPGEYDRHSARAASLDLIYDFLHTFNVLYGPLPRPTLRWAESPVRAK